MKTLLILTSLVALTACGKAGLHVDRCQQYKNDEGRWVYASEGCPQIGGGKAIALPRLADSPPNKPKPEPGKPKPEPDHKPKPDKPNKDKKPKSDNSDSNGKGGNKHDRTDKPQGPKEKRDDT